MKITTNFDAISKPKAQAWIRDLLDLEKRIKDLNDAKSAIYKRVKAEYNGAVQDGLKSAIRLYRMEPAQRMQAVAAGEYAQLFLAMMDAQPAPANGNAEPLTHVHEKATTSPAIRAAATGDMAAAITKAATADPHTHMREEDSFDPDTGEILEPAPIPASFPASMDDLGVTMEDVKSVEMRSATSTSKTPRGGSDYGLDELVIEDPDAQAA